MGVSTLGLGFEGRGRITAILGPTNTGKTHTAIERMLAWPTGMIGLPLRLLAREVYEKVVALRGEAAVALVTGEEKRVPPHARYFVCTVEAMPVDKPVHFVAVDEIQLAAHPERGHVFTDRLLNARGVVETMFLGSDTIAGLVERLVPTADVRSQPRLSQLSHAGYRRLEALPPRTAIVAFSAAKVYEIADRLRRRHGGAAVVLGALSPRARNAQVALYESGEVPYLVATDAIGMGLNLDVHHVALSSLRKFDGRVVRDLDVAEVAQIAGRAGRYRRDGTFGATADLEGLPDDLAARVAAHAFPALKRIQWRNADLDLSSVDTLVGSLDRPPPNRLLARVDETDDERVLRWLTRQPEVRRVADRADRVGLLWDVARVPDFRKTLTESHPQLLLRVYGYLTSRAGRLPADWVARQLERLDRVDGEIDLLTTRIAYVRTWTYLSHQRGWMDDADAVQEHALAIEDRLSDALHAQLTARFVDWRPQVARRGVQAVSDAHLEVEGDEVRVAGKRVGELLGIDLVGVARGDEALLQLLRVGLLGVLRPRVQAIVDARWADFGFERDGRITHQGVELARLVPGETLAYPSVVPRRLIHLHPELRAALEARLERLGGEVGRAVLGPLWRGGSSPRVDGVMGLLEVGLGTTTRAAVDALGPLDERERALLARKGVRVGMHHAYVAERFEPRWQALRALLWAVGAGRPEAAPPRDAIARGRWPSGLLAACGYRELAGLAVRVDVAEELAARGRQRGRRGAFTVPDAWARELGVEAGDVRAMIEALGFFRLPLGGEPRFQAR